MTKNIPPDARASHRPDRTARSITCLDYASPADEARAIGDCLIYLEDRAREAGLGFAGHLIGVAAQAVLDASPSHKHDGQKNESNRETTTTHDQGDTKP